MELETWLGQVGAGAGFEALAALLPGAAVVVTRSDRTVLYWSPEAERILGHPATARLGQSCPDGVVCDGDEPRPFGALARVPRADGGWVSVRQFTRVLTDTSGQAAGGVHVLLLDESRPMSPAVRESGLHGIITQDPGVRAVLDVVRNVAQTEATVLVRGESGTGKELVARAVHEESPRREGPFLAVNCAAFTPSLLESELFGHTRGAFTGASTARKGIFERADGGTLFLDEVAELSLDLQAKLLRVVQERRFVPIGGSEQVRADVRIVAATHRSLRQAVREGRFREDLMFRLRVVPIFLPALRERRGDIDLLARHFIDELNARGHRTVSHIDPAAMRVLLDHPWPGNVRELHNVIEYAFAVGRGPVIGPDELPIAFRAVRAPEPVVRRRPGRAALDVEAALAQSGGDIEAAAARLGVSRTTFWRLRKKAGLL